VAYPLRFLLARGRQAKGGLLYALSICSTASVMTVFLDSKARCDHALIFCRFLLSHGLSKLDLLHARTPRLIMAA